MEAAKRQLLAAWKCGQSSATNFASSCRLPSIFMDAPGLPYPAAPSEYATEIEISATQDFGQLWEKTPIEIQDEIMKDIHREGHRNVLKQLRYQSRLLHAITTPLLFDRLIFRSREDVAAWAGRLDEYEQGNNNRSKLFWLKHVRTFKILRSYNYLRQIQDFISRISSYTIKQISHVVVQDAVLAPTQDNAQWVTDFICERKIPNLTWDNPTVPQHILRFLDYKFSSSLSLRNTIHFGASKDRVYTVPYLNVDLGLHAFDKEFSSWERVKTLRFNALDEETIEVLRMIQLLTELVIEVRYDLSPKKLSTYAIPALLPSIAGLHSLELVASSDAFLATTGLLLVNLPKAEKLRKLSVTFKLSWATLQDATTQLRGLVDQVITSRPPALTLFFIRLECYLLLSKDFRRQYPDIAEEIAKIVQYIEEIRKNSGLIQATFSYPLGHECNLEEFSRLLVNSEVPELKRTQGATSESFNYVR
ncbi:hypothetical protein CVT26_012352 [Gymnopilus dilepis]|uniref:Uncharacterized protein n=1 Tax=Gymnopilus dilepis TaxID=231916 RepID=A0A409WDC6_9AGAR|nr:hypothetical protein CVT26_012352 [Gymnopilus dilepis]